MAVRPPSLRSIAAFEAAARHQSFAKAADELNLTHGAISHAIKGLETRLASELFDRSGRGVILTEAGRVLAGRVRLSMSLLSEAFETRPWLQRSRLVVSVSPSVAATFIGPRLGRFRERHPDILLDLRIDAGLARVGEGAVDVGFRWGPGGWAGLSAVKLADEQLFPVASPDYEHMPATPADLLEQDLIIHPELPWSTWFAAAGVEAAQMRTACTINDSQLTLVAAAAGAGIALARSLLAQCDLAAGRLVKLFDVEVSANYSYWLVWSPVSPKLATIELFKAWLSEELKSPPCVSPF